MQQEQQKCPYTFSLEETAEGYAIHVKGDKEKLKAKLEAMEAYHEFRKKAKAAGMYHHRSHNCGHGFLSLIHKHIQILHDHHDNKHEPETAE